MYLGIYRIKAVLKVEIYIITSITINLIGQTVTVVIMYVKTFKSDVIVCISIESHNVT